MAESEKDDPHKFQEGQRILSKIEALCHKFRQTVTTIIKQVKQDEYKIAVTEVTEAQRKIDKRRMDELSRVSETQSRPLTALEKVRLQHLQKMEETEKKESELLTTPFPTLLDREMGGEAISGLDVETVLEDLMSPFVSGVLLEVENLYAVNQSILQLAAKCRSEAVYFQRQVKDLKAAVDILKREARENESAIVHLQTNVRERTDQLEGIRVAHFKEVIAVKEQAIENLKDKQSNVEEVLQRGGRGFDPHLLNSMGADAEGRNLDEAFQAFLEGQNAKLAGLPREGGSGGADGERRNKDGFEVPLKILRMESDATQMRFQLHLLRHGMQTWRDRAGSLSTEVKQAAAEAERLREAAAAAAAEAAAALKAQPSASRSLESTASPSTPEAPPPRGRRGSVTG